MSGPFNFIQQAKKFQENFKNMQNELAALEVEGIAGAGLVKVVMNGRYQTLKVSIDDSVLKEDKNVIEELIQAATCNAATKVEQAQKDKMSSMMMGSGLPMNMNFPFMPGSDS